MSAGFTRHGASLVASWETRDAHVPRGTAATSDSIAGVDVLVTGGTGVLGRAVVANLLDRGHDVRVLSRRSSAALPGGARLSTGDLGSGAGVRGAVAEADAIVHCASDVRRHGKVDVDGTHRLIEHARAARRPQPHLVFVSIVGCDRIPLGYYRTKVLAELAVAQSGLPWTVLRATQFHDLVLALANGLLRLPVVPVPKGLRDQPVDVRDVAARLGELVDAGPAGRAPDIGGPQVLTVKEILHVVAGACGLRRRLVNVPVPGRVYAGYRAGHHLVPDNPTGTRTFAEYVAEHVHRDEHGVRVDVPYQRR